MLYYLMRLGQRLAGVVPQRVRWWFGATIAEIIYWCWAEKRIATQKNMSIVLDLPLRHPQVRRTARRSWRNYGHYLVDFFDLPNHPPSYYRERTTDLSDDGQTLWQCIEAVRAAGHGAFITTGHYGNYDMAGVLAGISGPVYVITEQFVEPRLDALIQEQRRAMNLLILSVDNALRPMLRLLRQGELVAAPIDRPLPPNEGIPIIFFGRKAYVPRGLGAIAVRVGAAILPGFAWYDGPRGYLARVFPPVTVPRSGDEEADTIRATQVMYDALEVMIRHDPTQWYMFRRFWPDETMTSDAPSKEMAEKLPMGAHDD